MARARGRPSKLTAERVEKLLNSIRQGAPRDVAAAVAGISPTTLFRWLQTGRESKRKSAYRDLWERVKAAELEAEAVLLGLIARAGRGVAPVRAADGTLISVGKPGDWKAAAYLLEQRNRKRYGTKLVAAAGTDGKGDAVFTLTIGGLPGDESADEPAYGDSAEPE